MDGWMDKEIVRYIYTHTHNSILFSHKKELNLAIGNNIDGPWGQYVKWNKSDRERQILCDLSYMWNRKKTKQNKTESS